MTEQTEPLRFFGPRVEVMISVHRDRNDCTRHRLFLDTGKC